MIIGSMKTIEQVVEEYVGSVYSEDVYEALDGDFEGQKIAAKNDFIAGVKFAQQWTSINDELPEEDGNDYLLRNDKWIHEDYSPNGVRFGFFNSELEGEKWTHVHWSGYSDEYITEHDEPTHWRKINLI
jgi:hypothetical protein